MSASYIVPLPVRLDTFRAGEIDERAIDFTNDLAPYGDSLASVIAVTVVGRDDGAGLGPGDLRIIQGDPQRATTIDGTAMVVGWWQTSSDAIASNGVSIDYTINVRALTTNGRTIMCDAQQLVVPLRG
jgi:hypothetical protein